MYKTIVLYIITLLVLICIDLVYVTKNKTTLPTGWQGYLTMFLSWCFVAGGIWLLVLSRSDVTLLDAVAYGAAFGFTAYGLRDMSNFNGNWQFTLQDIAWGSALCAGLSTGALLLKTIA